MGILFMLFRALCGSWCGIPESIVITCQTELIFLTIIPAKTVKVVAVHCYRSQHWLDSQAENISAFSALDGLLHFDRALYATALSEVNSAKSWSTEDTIQQLIQLIFILFCYVGGIWIQIVQKLICLYFNSSGKITSQCRGCLYL